jgi:hypothetical protein
MSDDPDGDEDGEIGRAKEENDQVMCVRSSLYLLTTLMPV